MVYSMAPLPVNCLLKKHVLFVTCLVFVAACSIEVADGFGSPATARSYASTPPANAPNWTFQRTVSRWPAHTKQVVAEESVKAEFTSEKALSKFGNGGAAVEYRSSGQQQQTQVASVAVSENGVYTATVADNVQQHWEGLVGAVSQSAYSATGYFETSIATCRHPTMGGTWSACGNLVAVACLLMVGVVIFAWKLIIGRGRFVLPHGSIFDIRRLWRRKTASDRDGERSSSWKRRAALLSSSSVERDGSKTWYNLSTVTTTTTSSSSTASKTMRGAVVSCDDENVCRAKDDNYSCSARRLGATASSDIPVPGHVQLSDEALSFFGEMFRGDGGSAPTTTKSQSSYVFSKIVSMLDQAIERPKGVNLSAQCPKMKVPVGKPLTYEEAAAIFKPLDLFCVRSDTIYSNVIQYIQMASRKCGYCTHSGYFIDTSVIKLRGMVDGELYVVESLVDILPNGVGLVKDVTGAARNGVQIRSLREMMSAPEAEGCIFMGASLKPELRERLNDVIGHSRINKSAPCKLHSVTLSLLGKPYPMNPFNFMPGIDKHGITHRFADSIGDNYFCSELVTTVFARMGLLPAAMLKHARRVYPVDFLIDGILSPSSLFSSIHVIQ